MIKKIEDIYWASGHGLDKLHFMTNRRFGKLLTICQGIGIGLVINNCRQYFNTIYIYPKMKVAIL